MKILKKSKLTDKQLYWFKFHSKRNSKTKLEITTGFLKIGIHIGIMKLQKNFVD